MRRFVFFIFIILASYYFLWHADTFYLFHKKKVFVVMCDVTQSLDTLSSMKVKEKALELLEKAPDAEIFFYPIIDLDNSVGARLLLHKEPYSGKSYSEEEESKENDKKKLEKGLQEYLTRRYKRSCIISSFKIAHSKLKQFYKDSKYDLRLIILSDMLDYCSYEDFTTDLEKSGNYTTSIEATKKYKPTFDLSGNNVNVFVIMTSNQKSLQSEDRVIKFWQLVFANLGYNDEYFDECLYGDFPQNFFEKNKSLSNFK